MKKLLFVAVAVLSVSALSAQNDQKKKNLNKFMSRTGDHFMLQLSNDHWIGAPDSLNFKGLARGANVYIMLDQRFKGSPKFSVAFGIGAGTSNMYFRRMTVDIKSKNDKLPFNNLDSLSYFKKFKVNTVFLEVPLELRFVANPEKESRSIKVAVGLKVGTLLSAHTKGKYLMDKNGIGLNNYIVKENSKRFFNSTRIAGTARIGYGNFSLFGSYQFNNIFKDGVAAEMKLFQIGLCISGL
jgi:hypothetical protein